MGGPEKLLWTTVENSFPPACVDCNLLLSSEEVSAERALLDLHHPVLHTYLGQSWFVSTNIDLARSFFIFLLSCHMKDVM